MEAESSALLREIIRNPSESESEKLSVDAKSTAWNALPRGSFRSLDSFVALAKRAFYESWDPSWLQAWQNACESWNRLLVRLFVFAVLLDPKDVGDSQNDSTLSNKSFVTEMLDVMTMASQDAGVARLMLESRFQPESD